MENKFVFVIEEICLSCIASDRTINCKKCMLMKIKDTPSVIKNWYELLKKSGKNTKGQVLEEMEKWLEDEKDAK